MISTFSFKLTIQRMMDYISTMIAEKQTDEKG